MLKTSNRRTVIAILAVHLLTSCRCKVRVGLIGLPNVGKSTLFNALARKSIAHAANFPFCTIEPNIAPVAVPDEHLAHLSSLAGTERTVPATIEWVDIAGLAKGASRGEGLGNKFLGTVRECDAVCHVVRAFESPDTIHVEGRVDPADDVELINLELVLADLAHVERRLERTTCRGVERTALEAVAEGLQAGVPARSLDLAPERLAAIKSMGLLTLKPVLYAFNVDEVDCTLGRPEALAAARAALAAVQHWDPSRDMLALVSAQLEAELSQQSSEAQRAFLQDLGVDEPGALDAELSHAALPRMACELLGLATTYTGPGVPPQNTQTTKAHLFSRSSSLTAEGVAARLHGDISRGFIRAEVVGAEELLAHASFAAAKEAGCVRTEGRDYVVNDRDVVLIKWR